MDSYVITFLLIIVIGGVGMWLRKRYLKKVMAQVWEGA